MNHLSSFNPEDYCPNYKVTSNLKHKKQNSNVKSLFEKKFYLEKKDDIQMQRDLPSIDMLYTQNGYVLDSMKLLKTKSNECKSKLNDYPIEKWSQHTKKRNPAGDITWKVKNEMGCEFVTQAWCKLFECVNAYDLVPKDSTKINSLHLCEAPGAFVTALNHYLKSNFEKIKWDWCATTLNPYHEDNAAGNMIMDDRFILYTLDKWFFGADNTGNIMNIENINKLVEYCNENFDEIDLITADGSINCFDEPANQETKVSSLNYAEVVTALKILRKGGNFLIKMFTFFEFSSINLLYFLYLVFEDVHLFKPATSKCGNSEVYVICLNYYKQMVTHEFLDTIFLNLNNSTKSLFNLNFIDSFFLKNLENSQIYFCNFQLSVIENNILTYHNENYKYSGLNNVKLNIWQEYKNRYNLNYLDDSLKILQNNRLIKNNFNSRIQSGSYSERCRFNELDNTDKLIVLKNELYEYMEKYLFNHSLLNNLNLEYICSHTKIYNHNFDITVGKNIKKINGSKFLILPILNYFLNLLNYKNTILVSELKTNNNSFYELFIDKNKNINLILITSNYYNIQNYSNFEIDLIKNILTVFIENYNSINNLIITNLPLLTHLFVSFVYYFSKLNIFENIKFHLNQTASQIIFNNRVSSSIENDKIKNLLITLRNLFTKYEKRDETLLSFIKIPNLYTKCFYNSIENYNRFLCLHLCQEYLKEIE